MPRGPTAGRPLGAFSVACLQAHAPCDCTRQWIEQIESLFRVHGGPARVFNRIDGLRSRGYLTDGLPRVGYLTEKGRRALRRSSRLVNQ